MQLISPAFGGQFSPTFSSAGKMDATSPGAYPSYESKSAGSQGGMSGPAQSQSAGATPPPSAPIRFGLSADFFQSPYFSDIQRTPSHSTAGKALMGVLDRVYDSGWSTHMRTEANGSSKLSAGSSEGRAASSDKVSASETFSTGGSKVDKTPPAFHLNQIA